jgi:hypothetical protein
MSFEYAYAMAEMRGKKKSKKKKSCSPQSGNTTRGVKGEK